MRLAVKLCAACKKQRNFVSIWKRICAHFDQRKNSFLNFWVPYPAINHWWLQNVFLQPWLDYSVSMQNHMRMKFKTIYIIQTIFLIFAFSSVVSAEPHVAIKPIASGLIKPVAITHAGDGSGRLFITLQGGEILIYKGRQLLSNPFLDVSPLVSTGGERGLLSIAFHPDYANNGFLFLNYTNTDGATVIARYRVSPNPNVVDPASAKILLTIPQPSGNHNGGQLQFGPDGFLYIGMGDGGSTGDPSNFAQNSATLLGKMLRIDVDTGSPYTSPSDNPFVGNPQARDEIWASGLRNPWRFSFDRLNGDLFIADVGQRNWEEVNFQRAESMGGENYGWRLMEGNHCYEPDANCNDGSLVLPILEYGHSLGDCSITGGYRYRGTKNPRLYGLYIYGDFCSGRIWGAVEAGSDQWTAVKLLDTDFRISAFGEDEAGEIYVAQWSSTGPGAVYRLSQLNEAMSAIHLLLLF